jgi:exodeoxyribonuclease V beta subunit
MYGDTSVFDTPEADAVERLMRAMVDPGNAAAIGAALLTPLIGLSGDELAAARADERQWEQWVERFRGFGERWKASGFAVAFRHLLDDRDVPARLLSRRGGERAITNALHLGELLQAAAVDDRRGPLALVEWLQRMRGDAAARGEEAAETAQIRLESDTHALKLITIHKSKGLQFPVVVCPFLWDGMLLHPDDKRYVRFHAGDDGDPLTLDLGSPPLEAHRARCEREALAEHRLLYVALTRAQQLCLVARGSFRAAKPRRSATRCTSRTTRAPRPWRPRRRRVSNRRATQRCAPTWSALAAAANGAIEIAELSTEAPESFAAAQDAGGP